MAPNNAGVARTKRMPAVTSRHVAVARSVTTCAVPIAAGNAARNTALIEVAAITAMYGAGSLIVCRPPASAGPKIDDVCHVIELSEMTRDRPAAGTLAASSGLNAGPRNACVTPPASASR